MNKVNQWREKCYSNVPNKLYLELKNFRSLYPYKCIKNDGQEWQYILTEGGPKVLLMLPGSTATGESNWREIRRLTPEYRVISISYPPVKSPEALFNGILKILDTEGIKNMDIFAASMGGAIAHWLIRNHPQRVNKLILLSIGMPDKNTAKNLKNAVSSFSLLPSYIINKAFEREAARLVSVLPEDEAKLMAAYFKDLYRNDMNKRTILCHFRLVADIAEKVLLLGLDKLFLGPNPVLIINAADDETISKEARDALIATYPSANVFLFPSGGHTLFSRREELNRIIDEFLRK
jgi:maspardin